MGKEKKDVVLWLKTAHSKSPAADRKVENNHICIRNEKLSVVDARFYRTEDCFLRNLNFIIMHKEAVKGF